MINALIFITYFILENNTSLNISIIVPIIVGLVFVFIISIIKEFADTKFDWYDILGAMIGCFIVIIYSIAIKYLSELINHVANI